MKAGSWHRLIAVLPFVVPAPVCVAGPDYERERTIAEELVAGLETGEAVWLNAVSGSQFLALFTRASGVRNSTAVILVHGMGAHPDWPVVIAPLRRSLPAAGWATLSLQMPVLSPETPEADYGRTLERAQRRIRAGVTFLREEGYESVVLIGYSFGAATAARYLANVKGHGVDAFAGISMIARKFLSPSLDLLEQLAGIDVPVLDIYGANDLNEVLQTVADRRLAAGGNGRGEFLQVVIEGADHFYARREEALQATIEGWLVEVVSQKTAGARNRPPGIRAAEDR